MQTIKFKSDKGFEEYCKYISDRLTSNDLIICRPVRYGKNQSRVRFVPVERPSRLEIKNLLLKIIRMKNGRSE